LSEVDIKDLEKTAA